MSARGRAGAVSQEGVALSLFIEAMFRDLPDPAPAPAPRPEAQPSPAPAAAPAGDLQCLVARAGALRIALPLDDLGGVIPMPERLVQLPGQPAWVLGVLVHGADRVQVVDTFGLLRPGACPPGPRPAYRRVLVLKEGRWGIACEHVSRVRRIKPEDLRRRGARGRRPWLAGTVLSEMCALIAPAELAAWLRAGAPGSAQGALPTGTKHAFQRGNSSTCRCFDAGREWTAEIRLRTPPGGGASMRGTDDMANAVQSVQDPVTRWVTFSLGEETYGIDVMKVQEVLRMTEIAPVPGAPDYVIGIINLRGNVVTVIDSRKRFMLGPKEPDEATRIVIIESNKQVVGILVDSVAEVIEIRDSQVETAPNVGNDESSKYIQGVFSQGEELVILVDLNKLLSDDEWDDVSGF